jgi:Right handed beta helix region
MDVRASLPRAASAGSGPRLRPVALALVVTGIAFAIGIGGASAGSPIAAALPPPLATSKGPAIYVSTKGANSNPGTIKRPKRTIQSALNRARPGQRILVRGGLYEENLLLERSGTRAAPITLAAVGPGRPVVRSRATGRDTYALEIKGSFVRVSGLVFEGASGASSANIYVEDGGSNIEISRNEIRNGQDQGVFTEPDTSNVQVFRNVVHHNGAGFEGQHQSHGLYMKGDRHLIANNLVYDHPHGFGIQIYRQSSGTIIVGNTVAYSGWSGIVIGGDDVSDILVRNNIAAYNARYGIAHDSHRPESSRVDNNLTYANGWGDIGPDFQGTDLSGGNVSAPPRFVSARNRDFRLTRKSNAIDRAVPEYAGPVDLAGVVRPQGAAPDLGAYEFIPR